MCCHLIHLDLAAGDVMSGLVTKKMFHIFLSQKVIFLFIFVSRRMYYCLRQFTRPFFLT